MGCGKSKHAVVTENTVVSKSNSKRSNSIKKDDSPVDQNQIKDSDSIVNQKPIKDGIMTENAISNELVSEEPENEKTEPKNDVVKVANVDVQVLTEKIEEIESVEAKEEINDVINTKEEEFTVGVQKKVEEGTTVPDSPNEFLFDHEETIESIIPEGISKKSEYHSPRAKHLGEDVAAKKVNGQEAQPEDKLEAGKEDGIKVDEGKDVVLVEKTKEPVTQEKRKLLMKRMK